MSDDSRVFIFFFSQEGFESILDATAIEEENLIAKMSDRPCQSVNSILRVMEIRAMANSQRRCEIWAVRCADGITEGDLRALADTDAQQAADMARKHGTQLFPKGGYDDSRVVIR